MTSMVKTPSIPASLRIITAGSPLHMMRSNVSPGTRSPARNRPTSMAATFCAPTTGRRAALALPPLSAVYTASGAKSANSPSMSPVAAAVRNSSVTRLDASRSTGSNRLRRDCTCSRARCAIWRTALEDLPIAVAISSWLNPNTSRSTNTARSSGVSVSRTTSMAIETDSARTTSAEASPATPAVNSSGSGSHGPTYSSRRRDWARRALSDWRVTSWARNALVSRTVSRSTSAQRR